jgi:hypothetical protein
MSLKGYVSSSVLANDLGYKSDRRIKDIARKENVDYFSVGGVYWMKEAGTNGIQGAIVRTQKKVTAARKKAAKKAASTRAANGKKKA